MVFHCRCFSFLLEENKEIEEDETIEYETRTQTKSTTTFFTAASDFNSHAKPSEVSEKPFILPRLIEGTETFDTAGPYLIQSKLSEILSLDDRTSNLRVFTVAELETATGNFSTVLKWDEGGFGSVYKGVIKSLEHPFNEIQVAVKIPTIVLQVLN
ncbi:putative protein kinase-like domain superfamily [Helianthus annuus]|nr:putative protein kinase-like domain superfamily [Helianthus annuus]